MPTGLREPQEVQIVEDPELLNKIRSYGAYDLLTDLGKRLGRTVDIEELKNRPELSEDELEQVIYTSILSGVSPGPSIAGKTAKVVKGLKAVDKTLQKLPPVSATGKGFEAAKQLEDVKTTIGAPRKWTGWLAELGPVSPKTAFKLDKSGAGGEIYQIADRTSQAKNRFLVNEVNQFKLAQGKIKLDSESSRRVGRALDAKLPVEQLTAEETRLYNFLHKQFDFLYRQFARQAADSPESYNKLSRIVSKGFKPEARVADLKPADLQVYTDIDNLMQLIRGKKKASVLVGKDKKMYGLYKQAKRKIRQKAWSDNLTPGDKEAYSILQRKIKHYLPHIFDRDELLANFRQEIKQIENKLRTATEPKKVNALKKRLGELESSVQKFEGGELITYEQLPQKYAFRFLGVRKGKEGYSFDAVKAYQTYLFGFAKKFYGDPALQRMSELYKGVDVSMKPYTSWFIKNWAGVTAPTKAEQVAGIVASWQWMSKLGLNPRSAITNFTQRLNTIAEVGLRDSVRGYAMAWTPRGEQMFARTGLAEEVPTVLMEGTVAPKMEKIRQVIGYLFTKVELGNRKHAFLAGYLKAKRKGMDEKDAIQYGIDIVHKTQFRYGKVGTPKMLSGPFGRLAFQFWSYPIKQVEFLAGLAKEGPEGIYKLTKLLALAEGGNYYLGKFLSIDLSNALGFGLNYGEAIKVLSDLKEGEWKDALRHTQLVFKGGGLLPTSFGPTGQLVVDWMSAAGKGKGTQEFVKGISPAMLNKIRSLAESLKEGSKGSYPIYTKRGELIRNAPLWQVVSEAVGPRTVEGSKSFKDYLLGRSVDKAYEEHREKMLQLMVEGDIGGAAEIAVKQGIELPTADQLNEWMKLRHLPADLRRQMETGERRIYRYKKEGL